MSSGRVVLTPLYYLIKQTMGPIGWFNCTEKNGFRLRLFFPNNCKIFILVRLRGNTFQVVTDSQRCSAMQKSVNEPGTAWWSSVPVPFWRRYCISINKCVLVQLTKKSRKNVKTAVYIMLLQNR